MRVNIGTVRAFPGVRTDKAQALKVVEEAAEVFSAWEQWSSIEDEGVKDMLVGEIADCVTALGVYDLARAVKEAEVRNIERGRYNDAD